MVNITTDASKGIFRLAKTGDQQDLHLNWTSEGFVLFLVLSSSTAESVDLTGTGREKIETLLSEHLNSLADNTEKKIDGITIRLITFTQQKRDGGMELNGDPGYFAVYGVARIDDQNMDIYVNESSAKSHLVRVLRDVEVTESPYMVQKGGLFSKKMVYSGYHRISVKGPNKGMSGGVLRYSVGEYMYPFPDQIVTDGGNFFVKMDERAALTISSDNEGLNINLRKRT